PKAREPCPVVAQTAQDLCLGEVEVRLVKMRLAARVHLTQLRGQSLVAFGKGQRLLLERCRLIPHLKTSLIEAVELADIFDPGEHPPLELRPTARPLEKNPPDMRPTKG